MYDRVMKQRIFYYNKSRKMKRQAVVEKVTAGDVKKAKSADSPYDQYGKDVPVTIPGSKGYWSSRLMDLLAMTDHFGQPQLFVTMTQNDNWPELQATVTGKPQKIHDLMEELAPEHGESCMEHSTVTAVAFFERFRLFREKVFCTGGSLGDVVEYWYRVEYQKRGAIHIHMALWCSNMPPDVVTAEMPRHEDADDQFTKVARSYVTQYQLHKNSGPMLQRAKQEDTTILSLWIPLQAAGGGDS